MRHSVSRHSARTIRSQQLADHSVDGRMILLSVMAPVVGTGGAFGAWLLLKSIAIVTNAFWFGRLSAQDAEISDSAVRSEEHTSELQSLMRISYAVFCLKKKNKLTEQE